MIRLPLFLSIALIFLFALGLVKPGLVASQPAGQINAHEPAEFSTDYEDQPQSAASELTLTTDVIADSPTILNGDVVTYTINLSRETGDGLLRVDIDNALPFPLRLAGRITVNEIQPEVQTGEVQVRHRRDRDGNPMTLIRWRGRLSGDAEVQLVFPVRVYAPCQSGRPTETVTNIVRARPFEGDSISASASFTMTCPQISLDDILVSLEVVDETEAGRSSHSQPGETLPENSAVRPMPILGQYPTGNFLPLRVTMTNQAEEQAIVGYHLTNFYVEEISTLPTKIIDVTQVILDAGETRSFTAWVDMRPLQAYLTRLDEPDRRTAHDAAPEDDDLLANFDLYHMLLPYAATNLRVDLDGPLEILTTTQQIRLRAWDFGDAPDSGNHLGLAMTAYPGVTANFPTVFNPDVSNPSGPAHARPHHFHLGRSVSLEADADLGTDPNIDPANDIADLDQFDDGANPHAWNLTDCRPAQITVEIYISREAAVWFQDNRLKGYLNGWLDGNRDGDWSDTFACRPDDLPLPDVALEHFIIDHEIDVAGLGPGYHTLRVNTGRVPWPADKAEQPAWTRLTLSERPSAKIGRVAGIEYGDGRGHERPFRTGETEDYLLRPPGSPGAGPDMAVTMHGDWRPIPAAGDPQGQLAFNFEEIKQTWAINYVNQGTERAENVELHIEFSEPLSQTELEERADLTLVAPRRGGQPDYALSDNLIVVNLGWVAPGERGSVILELGGDEVFAPMTNASASRDVIPELGGDEVFPLVGSEATAAIISAQDINPDNTIASFRVDIDGVAAGHLLFKSPDAPFLVQQGTTNSPDLILRGFYQERIANEGFLTLWVHRVMVDGNQTNTRPANGQINFGEPIEIPIDENGHWEYALADLPDGYYQFAAGDPAACDANRDLAGNDNEWRYRLRDYGSACSLVVVDTSLPIDPISMIFTDSDGRIFLADGTLHWREGNWNIRLPQGAYTATMNLTGDFDNALLRGMAGLDFFEAELVETGAPGRYQTNFIIGDGGGMPGSLANITELDPDDPEDSLSLLIETAGEEIAYTGDLGAPAWGRVETIAGQPLPEAAVTLFTAWEDGETAFFFPWDGGAYGQSNPVVSDETGDYALIAPSDPYWLYATAEGFQPYRTGILGSGGAVTRTITLAPELGAADYVVGITAHGFEPALSAATPNSLIRFINNDSEARRIVGDDFDSGLLLLGESFTIQAGESGMILFYDAANPTSHGTIIIDPFAGQQFVFLPLVVR